MLQRGYLREFIENISPSLSKLVNVAWMIEEQTYDNYSILTFDIDCSYTLLEVANIMEDNAEIMTLYHHMPTNHTAYGHSICAFSNPNFGLFYKINAQTEENGKVPYIYVTLYASSDTMLADLRLELAHHSCFGFFIKHISEETLLQHFICYGIDNNIYERIVNLIKRLHTNISVLDSKLYMEHTIPVNKRDIQCMCRTLVLKGKENPALNEHKWYIPDIKIKMALIKYCSENSKAKVRIRKQDSNITAKDVERIINIASEGQIHLNLKNA